MKWTRTGLRIGESQEIKKEVTYSDMTTTGLQNVE